MNELVALVKFNRGKAFVLKNELNFKYQKHGGLLIGIDESETFVDCLFYERPTANFKAFAGREFDIKLENGETIHCNGQWWHGGTDKAEKLLGKEIVSVTVEDVQGLKDCYVFTGCFAFKHRLEELADSYTGKLYEYREYEEELKIERVDTE